MAVLKPGSVTLGSWKVIGGGTALAAITGVAGKEVTSPTTPTELAKSLESPKGELSHVVVKPELPAGLKAALEAGKKVLSLEAFVFTKQPNTNKRTSAQIFKNSELFGAEVIETAVAESWLNPQTTKALIETIKSVAAWEELELFIVHGAVTIAGESSAYEVYFVATWEETAGVTIPLSAAASTSAASLAVTAGPRVPTAAALSASAASLAVTAAPVVALTAASSTSVGLLAVKAGPLVGLSPALSSSSASATVTVPSGTTVALSPASSSSAALLAVTAAPKVLVAAATSESSAVALVIRVPVLVVLSAAVSTSSASMRLVHVAFSAGGFPRGVAAGGSTRSGSVAAGGSVSGMRHSQGGSA